MANREAAAENIRALQLLGIYLESSAVERDDVVERELRAMDQMTRTFRAETTYKVTSGKWYYEFEVLSEGIISANLSYSTLLVLGLMRIGWMVCYIIAV